MIVLKRCKKCGKDKELKEFRRQTKNKDGLQYFCRVCMDTKNKERYVEKKEHIVSKIREWQINNPEMVKGYRAKNLAKRQNTEIPATGIASG